jgi:hypothetical protein
MQKKNWPFDMYGKSHSSAALFTRDLKLTKTYDDLANNVLSIRILCNRIPARIYADAYIARDEI